MTRLSTVFALVPILGCAGGGEGTSSADAARIQALEADVADLQERVVAAEAAQRDNGSRITSVEADVAAQAGVDAEQGQALADLTVRVDGHDLAVAQASGAVAGLESRLYDPDYGDLTALEAAQGELAVQLQTNGIDLGVLQGATSTNTAALAALSTTVTDQSTQILANSVLAADNAAELADQRADLDANTADLVALESVVGIHDATLVVHNVDIDTLEDDVASNAAAIGANSTAVAAVEADVSAIQSNYLPPLDDLLLYVSADPATDTVTVAQGDLVVDGRTFSDDLTLRRCDDTLYACTPMECLDACAANGERIATTDEVLAWAAKGNQACQWAWMIDRNNPSVPVYSYPMFNNRVNPGCGPLNTGNVPRFGEGPFTSTWGTAQQFNCACTSG